VIKSSGSWTAAQSGSWFTTAPGNDYKSLIITPSYNNTGNQRTGSVIVSYGGSSKTINITQKAPLISVTPTTMVFDWDGGSKTATVTGGGPWTVTKSDSWISLSATSGSGYGTFSVSTPTNTGDERYGTVTITDNDGGSHVINITQYK
jgi:hypothetical protein